LAKVRREQKEREEKEKERLEMLKKMKEEEKIISNIKGNSYQFLK